MSTEAAYEVVRLHLRHHAEERDPACTLCAFENYRPESLIAALDAEREVCASLADAVWRCYSDHTDDCRCTGEAAWPFEVGRRIRGRKEKK